MDEVYLIASDHSPDVLCVTESWLDSSISDSAIHIPGYVAHRADRVCGTKGGGVLCWVKSSFRSEKLFHRSQFRDVELLVVRTTYRRFKCLMVIVYYPKGRSLSNSTVPE